MMEDVMKVFYFLFFYFFLQSINKEIESLAQTQIFKPLEADVVNLWYFKFRIFWSNRIHSLKYLRSTTFGSKDIVIRKSEFVARTKFLNFHKEILSVISSSP